MIDIKVDETELEQIYRAEIQKRLEKLDKQMVFWDMKTLCRVTCMSEPFIKEQFFYDPRFPKYRVGKKWLFPARETEDFLIKWLKEQPKG